MLPLTRPQTRAPRHAPPDTRPQTRALPNARPALLMAALCLTALTLAATPARAQQTPPPDSYTWTTTNANGNVTGQSLAYSGGTHTFQAAGGVGDAPFSGGGYGGGDSWNGYPTAGTVSCTGPLTAAFTWSGPDALPQSVVVVQSCLASWDGGGYTAPTGSCANGLGDPEEDSGSPHGASGIAGASGTYGNGSPIPISHYAVMAGASSLPLDPVSASASCSFPAQVGGSASVSYTAAAYPVTIDLSGYTNSQYPNDYLFGLAADPATASIYPNGEEWYHVAISVPPGFTAAGTGFFTQLWTPNEEVYAASEGSPQY